MKEDEIVEEVIETEETIEEVEVEEHDLEVETEEIEETNQFEEHYESKKPLRKLITLVAFTAIMLVSSTYAWFSTQKNVTIGGLRGEVNVAEGLQISLDAKTWTNTINLNEFRVDTNTKIWTSDKYVPGATFQQPYVIGQKTVTGEDGQQTLVNEYATNVTPEELLPVSTTGGTGEGIGNSIMNMYWGDNTEGIKLEGIKQMTEEAKSGYYAFDIFLQNSSAEGKTVDTLKLAPNSSVVINSTKESTGLQNTVRVGFALYENAKDDADTSNDGTVTVKSTPTTAEIIAGTSAGKKIKDVAIWEPNSDVHTTYIVDANNRITWSAADLKEYGFNAGATAPAKAKFTATSTTGVSQIPTYALTTASKTAGSINDIYDWATPSAGLTKQITLQTLTDTTEKDGLLETEALPLISIAKTEAGEENTEFQIGAGQYVKMRVYVWLEGQDVDCTNYASLGGGLTVDIGILKGDTEVEDNSAWVEPVEIYDPNGTDATKLHIGDFVNYDAGTWSAADIADIKTGLASSPVAANNSTNLPSTVFQFGGFTEGSSRNGNATPYNTTYNYVKNEKGEAITGWRVFDIDGNNVTLISAGNPEDYYTYYQYTDSSGATQDNGAYVSEYILTGNVNSSWTGATTSDYQIRDWEDYVNTAQKGKSATVLTKSALDTWYSKYTSAGVDADIEDIDTFQLIYDIDKKFQTVVDNYSFYWLHGWVDMGATLLGFDPGSRGRWYTQGGYNIAFGVRVLVSLDSNVLFSANRAGTTTLSGGNLDGDTQEFNYWNIK